MCEGLCLFIKNLDILLKETAVDKKAKIISDGKTANGDESARRRPEY